VLDGTTATTSYSFMGLTPNTTYSVSVVAFDAAGNESTPTAINVLTPMAPDTQAPTDVTGLASSNLMPTTFDVSWTASTDNIGSSGYDLYIGGVLDGTTTNTSYSFTGLSPNTMYSVSVVAFDAAGNQSTPTAIDVSTSPSPAPIIEIADAFTPNGDGINDTWVIQGIEEFPNNNVRLYNRNGHEVFQKFGYQNTWEGFYRDNNKILPSGSYYYVINLGEGNGPSTPMSGWIFINY
jgi:gliding motility-associated-like protein